MHKADLKIHLIFVCKYRKKLLGTIGNFVKSSFLKIQEKRDFTIKVMEVDLDHIHFLIDYSPKVSVTQIVRCLKQESTHMLWDNYPDYLKKYYWKERTFWSDGYFASSIGNASAETVRHYIETQG